MTSVSIISSDIAFVGSRLMSAGSSDDAFWSVANVNVPFGPVLDILIVRLEELAVGLVPKVTVEPAGSQILFAQPGAVEPPVRIEEPVAID